MSSTAGSAAPRLKRSLKLWHLIIIGLVIIQPTAPMGIYGVISNKAGGHVVTTILIAMVAMLLTAISYAAWPARIPVPAPPTPTSAAKSIPRSAMSRAGAW
jgi:amino acid transporter